MKKLTSVLLVLFLLCTLSVSVLSQKNETMTVKVYFTDSNDNPNMEDCGKVAAVNRIVPKVKGVARAALNELFKGPTKKENEAGLYSWFTKDSKHILKSINIKNGNAYVNFDKWVLENLGNATTSCGSASFFSEIETTLKQFPTVKKVFFAVEKNPAAFYEWMQSDCPEELKKCDNTGFIDSSN